MEILKARFLLWNLTRSPLYNTLHSLCFFKNHFYRLTGEAKFIFFPPLPNEMSANVYAGTD